MWGLWVWRRSRPRWADTAWVVVLAVLAYRNQADQSKNYYLLATLAIFLMKAHRPEKYRERSEVKTDGNLTINVKYEEE